MQIRPVFADSVTYCLEPLAKYFDLDKNPRVVKQDDNKVLLVSFCIGSINFHKR